MVNNSTNINKANNNLSSQIIEIKKRPTTYDVRNLVPDFGQAQECDRVKKAKGIPPLVNCISNSNDKYTIKKPVQISFHSTSINLQACTD